MSETIKYILFVGFRKLGEFTTIAEAKKYPTDHNLSGLFSLIGPNYSDSWYIPSYTNIPDDPQQNNSR